MHVSISPAVVEEAGRFVMQLTQNTSSLRDIVTPQLGYTAGTDTLVKGASDRL